MIMRIRPRFRIRSLFAVIAVFAVIGAWLSAKRDDARLQREGTAWVEQQNGHIVYDFEMPRPDGSNPRGAQPKGPAWLRNWLGIEFFAIVHGVILDNQEIADLTPLTKLKELRLLAINIYIMPSTDLRPIMTLRHLEQLTLDYTRIDRQQLATIKGELPDCEVVLGEHAWVD